MRVHLFIPYVYKLSRDGVSKLLFVVVVREMCLMARWLQTHIVLTC